MAAPAKVISTSIGFQDAKGNVVAGGLLRLTLSQTATVIATGGQVSTDPIFLPLDSNGKVTNTAIWFVDEISPTGLIYYGKVYKSDLVGEVPGLNALQYAPNGAGPYDLAVAAQSGPASPSYSQAVLLSPTSQQNGFINISGILNVGNAAAIGTSLTVGTTLGVSGASTFSSAITAPQVTQPATTIFKIVDNNAGTRFSIPANGTSQSTLNNTLITGGSTYGGTTQHVQAFISTGTFTIPTSVTSVKVTLVGGGGGGGGSTVTNNGGGGGSGGIAVKYLSGLTPGNTIAVTVGAGGTGVSTATGNAGASSTIASGTQTITTVTALPGSGGFVVAASSPGGSGASVSTNGDINGAGNPGGNSLATNVGGGGGGTFLGGAGNPAGSSAGNPAVANTGSGGSGAGAAGNAAGGTGGSGIVIFEWVT